MFDLRSPSERLEGVEEQYVVACELGQVVTVWDEDLSKLPAGEYDELASETRVIVTGLTHQIRVCYRLRRIR